jgi:hypothetical protein
LLRNVLWKDRRYSEYYDVLLQLFIQSGLAVPLRGSSPQSGDHWLLVPALLPAAPPTLAPPNGPSCLLYLTLEPPPRQHQLEPITSERLQHNGYMYPPAGAFDHLCAVGIGWVQHSAKGFEPILSREFLQVQLSSQQVLG